MAPPRHTCKGRGQNIGQLAHYFLRSHLPLHAANVRFSSRACAILAGNRLLPQLRVCVCSSWNQPSLPHPGSRNLVDHGFMIRLRPAIDDLFQLTLFTFGRCEIEYFALCCSPYHQSYVCTVLITQPSQQTCSKVALTPALSVPAGVKPEKRMPAERSPVR